MLLGTFDWQRDYFVKHGYRICTRTEDDPKGHSYSILTKELGSNVIVGTPRYPEASYDDFPYKADNAKRNLKLPLIKKKYKGLAAITLVEEDGVLKQTTNDVHHYTWWRTNSCNLTKAKVV